MFCLNKNLTSDFMKKLKSGEIDPAKLVEMTSQERRDFFSKFLGEENARQVNALFESKLLLKNQQQGIITWAKKVAGITKEAEKDILSRVDRMTEVLQPKDMDKFLEDLAAQKLGVGVTMQEAGKIAELAKSASTKKESIPESASIGSDVRLAYGRARVAFDNYVSELKANVKKPITVGGAISGTAGLAKSLKASLDNSVIGRQGLKVLFTNPKIWAKNSAQTFVDIFNTYKGREVIDEVKADVLSRPNAINGLYKKEKLAVGVTEEAFPTALPEKIPYLGRLFKGSQAAFTAFQYRTRADVFDKYVEIAKKSGGDIEGIGLLANSLTGRGNIGPLEPSAQAVNNIFFSPRLLKSNIDALTGHVADYGKMGTFAKKQAAINTLKIITGVATILAIAKAIDPDSVDFDPRGANFGKIRVNDTRFDVSGGMSAIVILASRLATQSSKSSVTNKVTKLNSGKFGAKSGTDVIYNFFENKLSPAAAVLKDLLKGSDFSGNKPTLMNEAKNLLLPLPINTFIELQSNPNSANIIVAMIADALGISVNTYSGKTKKD